MLPLLTALAAACVAAPPAPDELRVRDGYRVETAIADLPGARFLEFDDHGTLYVSLPGQGEVAAFNDADSDGRYERLGVFVTGHPSVHALCFHDGWLWFATPTTINRARDADGDGQADETVEVLSGLPRSGHWWRSLFVTPDGFYTSIGDNGNATHDPDSDRQKLWRYNLDGSGKTLIASGLRNTEKVRFRPGTQELWGLDHGSDWFGRAIGDRPGNQPITDLNPPDEFNRYVEGGFYGHPFITGNRIPRYEYLSRPDIHDLASETTPPEWSFGAHWATNGFTFIDPQINTSTGAFPADHAGDAFVGCHGSWNSSEPVGFCIARVLFDGGKPYGLLKIVDGAPTEGGRRVRPVDCIQAPDGSILFSADDPGRVYRLTWVGSEPTAP